MTESGRFGWLGRRGFRGSGDEAWIPTRTGFPVDAVDVRRMGAARPRCLPPSQGYVGGLSDRREETVEGGSGEGADRESSEVSPCSSFGSSRRERHGGECVGYRRRRAGETRIPMLNTVSRETSPKRGVRGAKVRRGLPDLMIPGTTRKRSRGNGVSGGKRSVCTRRGRSAARAKARSRTGSRWRRRRPGLPRGG